MSSPARLPCALALALAAACASLGEKKPAWQELEHGLRARDVLVSEDGAPAAPGAFATVHYELRLLDGTLLDSSYDRGLPIRFEIGAHQVPAGLERGVIGMRRGGRRALIVPPELGYGAQGQPPLVPPDATLRFDVELVDLAGPEPAPRASSR